jgi:hypothetical protein
MACPKEVFDFGLHLLLTSKSLAPYGQGVDCSQNKYSTANDRPTCAIYPSSNPIFGLLFNSFNQKFINLSRFIHSLKDVRDTTFIWASLKPGMELFTGPLKNPEIGNF